MRALILTLLLSFAPHAEASVPPEVYAQYEKLLNLGDNPDGACNLRANVWKQQLKQNPHPEFSPTNIVIYFSKNFPSAIKNWSYHIAPGLMDKTGFVWVMEKSPYLNGVFGQYEWLSKMLGRNDMPCEFVNTYDQKSSFFSYFRRDREGEMQFIPSPMCYYTTSVSTNPYAFIKPDPNLDPNPVLAPVSSLKKAAPSSYKKTAYDWFISGCEEVIGVELYQSSSNKEDRESFVEIPGQRSKAEKRCKEIFPPESYIP